MRCSGNFGFSDLLLPRAVYWAHHTIILIVQSFLYLFNFGPPSECVLPRSIASAITTYAVELRIINSLQCYVIEMAFVRNARARDSICVPLFRDVGWSEKACDKFSILLGYFCPRLKYRVHTVFVIEIPSFLMFYLGLSPNSC